MRNVRVVLVLVPAVLLASCSGGGSARPAVSGSPSPSPSPTASAGETAAQVCADLARVHVTFVKGTRPDASTSGRRAFVQAQVRSDAMRPVRLVVDARLTDPRTGDWTGGRRTDVIPAGTRTTLTMKGFGLLTFSGGTDLRWDRRSISVVRDGQAWDGTRCVAGP